MVNSSSALKNNKKLIHVNQRHISIIMTKSMSQVLQPKLSLSLRPTLVPLVIIKLSILKKTLMTISIVIERIGKHFHENALQVGVEPTCATKDTKTQTGLALIWCN